MRRFLFVQAVLLLILTLGSGFAIAQSRLFDGTSLGGRIAEDSPSAQYAFDASTGERIGLRVLGLNGLDPMVTILGPDGAELLTGFDDAWSPEPADTFLTFSAPVGGAYSVLVAGEEGSSGDFLLQFTLAPAGSAALLPGSQTTVVPVAAAGSPLRLQFATSPDCPTILVIQPSGILAIIHLYDETGTLIGQVNASSGTEQRLSVAAGSGLYQMEVVPLPGSADGELTITLACAAEGPACREPAAPVAAPAEPAITPAGLLMVQPGGELSYGRALQGEIGQLSPLLGYSFEGAAGDEIVLQVTGISLDFDPVLSLLGPTQETLAVDQGQPGSFKPTDDLLRLTLPTEGRYTALVGSASDQAGAFLIRLAEQASAPALPLTPDAPAVVDQAVLEALDDWFLRYQFSALESCPTALTVETSDGRPLAVGVMVRRVGGVPVGQFYGSTLTGAHLLVPAGSGDYEVLIQRYGDLEELGQLTLRVSCQADSPACQAGSVLLISTPAPGESPFPIATLAPGAAPTVTLVGELAGDVTGVVSVPSANVRQGDSTGYAVVRALSGGTQVAVVGVSVTGSGWYKIITPQGDQGWMSPRVLTVTGDVDALPSLVPPAAPASTSAPAAGPSPQPGSNAVCGNGWCEGDEAGSCCSDCGTCGNANPVCGNGTCESGENCSNCASDCGSAHPENACANYCVCPDGITAATVDNCSRCASGEICGTGIAGTCTQPQGG